MSTPALTTLSRTLLRQRPYGVLATHSQKMPDFPFASVVPYVTDAAGYPLFCMSTLAEHTQNILANPHASFLVYEGGQDVSAQARLTLVGQVLPCLLDAETKARFLRYLPDTTDYLQLGDFAFYRFIAQKLRYIGGFGHMGWHDAESLYLSQPLSHDLENQLLTAAQTQQTTWTWLGADGEGIDYLCPHPENNALLRKRLAFSFSDTQWINPDIALRNFLDQTLLTQAGTRA